MLKNRIKVFGFTRKVRKHVRYFLNNLKFSLIKKRPNQIESHNQGKISDPQKRKWSGTAMETSLD
jgi:hypothetical protein